MIKNVADIITNVIHKGKQYSESREMFYLTVKKIGKIATGGRLDFGGSEYSEAEIEWLEPQKKSPEDTYGWWEVENGYYLVEYNEGFDLPEDSRLFFQPWEKALKAGITHPSGFINEPRKTFMTQIYVGTYKVGIKENARISEVFLV